MFLIFSAFPTLSFSEIYVSGNVGMMFLPDFEYSNDVSIGWYHGSANSLTEGAISTINGLSTVSGGVHRSIGLSGAVGVKIYDAFRVELEALYTKTDFGIDFDMNLDIPERVILGGGSSPSYDSSYDNNTLDSYSHLKGEILTWTFLCNSYYDFKIHKKFNPFVGIGLGLVDAKLKFSNVDHVYGDSSRAIDETAFAYQLMAGISCVLDEKTNIDIKYRYLDIADDDFLDPHFEFNYQGIMIGLRRYF